MRCHCLPVFNNVSEAIFVIESVSPFSWILQQLVLFSSPLCRTVVRNLYTISVHGNQSDITQYEKKTYKQTYKAECGVDDESGHV